MGDLCAQIDAARSALQTRMQDPDWIPAPMHQRARPAHGVLVVGDVHGRWDALNRLVRGLRPAMVFVCGDLGYMPHLAFVDDTGAVVRPFDPAGKLVTDVPIHFCDGNHDDHATLGQYRGAEACAHEIAPNLFYQERGSVLTLPDDRRVLFMGGAESADRHRRTEGLNWWPQESIAPGDLERLSGSSADIVISHTSPQSFSGWTFCRAGRQKSREPSRAFLQVVLDRVQPKRWYFGHWHDPRFFGVLPDRGIRYACLGKLLDDGCWLWLPDKYDRRPRRALCAVRTKRPQSAPAIQPMSLDF